MSRQQLSYLARTGSLERVAQGIYRLQRFPAQRFEDVIVACLWAGNDAVASHDTALAVYEVTDAMPSVIHVSVSVPFRGERPGIVVHTTTLSDDARTDRAGVPVTTMERTITDVLARSGEELARPAAGQALERGLVTRRRLLAASRAMATSASRYSTSWGPRGDRRASLPHPGRVAHRARGTPPAPRSRHRRPARPAAQGGGPPATARATRGRRPRRLVGPEGQTLLARLGNEARATKDADATWRAALDDFGDVLEAAVDADLGDGFRFEAVAPRPMTAETDEGGLRYAILTLLDEREFERIQLDVNAVPDDKPPRLRRDRPA